MREYERQEPIAPPRPGRQPVPVPVSRPRKRPKVNRAAFVLGDPLVVLGGFLRVFSHRHR